MGILDGETALVTGGGRGIGRGIALALCAEGATVAVLGRSRGPLEETVESLAARGHPGLAVECDVRDSGQIRSAVETVVGTLGHLRILVNNAQIVPHGLLLDTDEEAIDDGWRSGPLAALRMMRACHPHLVNGGRIVNIGSGAAQAAGPPGHAVYGAVKAALAVLTRAAAVEWGPDGIRVNLVLPLALTPAIDAWRVRDPDGYQAVVSTVPSGRLGDPEADIGRAVVFLAGPDAGMVTGTTLAVDGGVQHLR